MSGFSAIVLAAGRSTRMGRDKALLEIDGQRLWERQRDVLVAAGATEVFLSARPDQPWARGVRGFTAVLHDAMPGCGPLVGITAGLERATTGFLMVLAIDLPRMSDAWFATLRETARDGRGAVGCVDGYFEPLAALYPRECMFLAWEALARGEFALQPWISRAVEQGLMSTHEIRPSEKEWFENWNTPESLPLRETR